MVLTYTSWIETYFQRYFKISKIYFNPKVSKTLSLLTHFVEKLHTYSITILYKTNGTAVSRYLYVSLYIVLLIIHDQKKLLTFFRKKIALYTINHGHNACQPTTHGLRGVQISPLMGKWMENLFVDLSAFVHTAYNTSFSR